MKHRTAVILGYIGLALAVAAFVIRLVRGRLDDWTDYAEPLGIALLMLSVIVRSRRTENERG